MISSAIWDLFSNYLHDRKAGVQIIRKIKVEENKSHIAREIIALTSLSYGTVQHRRYHV